MVSGECFSGRWMDIGTPLRLAELERLILQDNQEIQSESRL
jgi:NDP-sugar pyrophosphorylase family protein